MIEGTEACDGWVTQYLATQRRDIVQSVARVLYPFSWHDKNIGLSAAEAAAWMIVERADEAWLRPLPIPVTGERRGWSQPGDADYEALRAEAVAAGVEV